MREMLIRKAVAYPPVLLSEKEVHSGLPLSTEVACFLGKAASAFTGNTAEDDGDEQSKQQEYIKPATVAVITKVGATATTHRTNEENRKARIVVM
ncbi:hypothetical protein MRX96_032428 [Rhipicephalus microplus]